MCTFSLSSFTVLISMLRSVLQGVADAVEKHIERDFKEYTGPLASARASFHISRRGLKYRYHDKEEVRALKKCVDVFVEQFQV